MAEIENAQIESVSITMEDHGCITFWLNLKGKSWGCGFGGYCIGHGYLGAEHFDGSPDGIEAMARIMDTVGVSTWEGLAGKYCRVESEGWGGTINKIGNLIEDKWFDIKQFFKEKQKDGN